jgi:DNA-binding LacI/PurR family transcriptional regulator
VAARQGRGGKPGVVAVARAAGVSPSTVSNAFNRPERLSPALRERVLRVAGELGYGGPDPAARILRRGRAGAVAVILGRLIADALGDPATVRFLSGVSEATDPEQIALVLVPEMPYRDVPEGPAVRNAAADGLIVFSVPADDPIIPAVLQRNLPTVVVDSPAPPELARADAVDYVGIDDVGGAEAATRHLLELGHRRIGVLAFGLSTHAPAGPAALGERAGATATVTRARLEGCARALAAAGLDESAATVVQVPVVTPETAGAAAHALLDSAPELTAIFAFSDRLALAACAVARERGLAVPGDLSVAGFDDTAPAGARLTTVRQDHREKGRLAAARLLQAVNGQPPAAPAVPLATRLVVRATTGPTGSSVDSSPGR